MEIKNINIYITEKEAGWKISGLGRARTAKTAAGALCAVKRQAKKWADAGTSSIIKVTWEPCTGVGWLVVKAIIRE